MYCTALCQESTGGTEYVFAIPKIYFSYPPHVLITTSSPKPVSVSLTIPGLGFESSHTITRNTHADIAVPVEARISEAGKYSKTILVSSSCPVSVFAFDTEYRELDGFIVLPTAHLGTEYYVPSYVSVHKLTPAFFTVSALGHETSVYFATPAGQEHLISLKPYESYRFHGGHYEDLTGTFIRANTSISVTSGVYSSVGKGGGVDGMLANIPPVENWGHHFALAPFLSQTCGYVYRVMSANHTTTLTISNLTEAVEVQAGQYYEGDVSGEAMSIIRSDFPVLVVQYMKGYGACDSRGDSGMIISSPIESYYNNVTFPVFDTTYICTDSPKAYYISVITDCVYVDGLIFDDKTSMTDWDQVISDDGSMCSVHGEIQTGLHNVGHLDPSATFIVSVYMLGGCSGFAYSYQAAISLKGQWDTFDT